jgi:uncharacterized protein
MNPTMPRGRLVWYDLMTSDPGKAVAFYTKLLGWTITPMPMGDTNYDMWTTSKGPMGGVMQLPPEAAKAGAPSHWLMYVGTPDVAATVKEAAALGAKVYVPPQVIPDVGEFAVLADPQGATFAVYCSNKPATDEVSPAAIGEVRWHELATSDPVAAWTFYSRLFDWEKGEAHDMGPMGLYQTWGRPGWPMGIGAVYPRPPEMPVSAWTLYVRVADLDAAVALVPKLGGQVLMGPMEVPGGARIAMALDPAGACFALIQTPPD